MKTSTITIPHEIKTPFPRSTRIMALVREAVMRDLQPLTWDRNTRTKHVSIRMSDRDLALVENYMQRHGHQRLARVLAGLAYAAWVKQQKNTVPLNKRGEEKTQAADDPFHGRREQRRFYTQIHNALERHADSVILAEGGTGLGKSRVLKVLAGEMAQKHSPVIVAAPTIQVMAQIVSESATTVTGPTAVLLGRSQFVDPFKLDLWLASEDVSPDDAAAVRTWIAQGGPITSETGYAANLRSACPGICYLFDDLLNLCPSLAGADVCADEHTDDRSPPMTVYRSLRDQALSADIIFCTHATLIADKQLKDRKCTGLLPERTPVLLIDEAHQLASVAESLHSSSMSLMVLRHVLLDLRTQKVREAGRAAELCDALMDLLRRTFPESGPVSSARLPCKIPENLLEKLKKLSTVTDLSATYRSVLNRSAHILSALLRRDYGVHVKYSSVRRWPSIMCGPLSLSSFFSDFWRQTKAAVLVSGTLYLPGRTPLDGLNSHYMATLLNLPSTSNRLVSLPPVHPHWNHAYTTCIPGPQEIPALTPPSESAAMDEENYVTLTSRWYDAVAGKLHEIAETAVGGVLVLFTGYEAIEGVAARLAASGMQPRLVVQSRDAGFAAARRQFIELAHRAVRPVWLATGPAWTGLDLSDPTKAPADDNLLTDVVIPRVPFGTEHTTIHEHRKAVRGFSMEVYRAAFMFRQGIGRLMRREGVQNRRLWLLDARVWREDMPWFFAYFRRLVP